MDACKQEGYLPRQHLQQFLSFFSFRVLSFFPSFFAWPWLKIEWQSWREIVGQLPFMQIMPFDGGEFLMCCGYNRRIKHWRPGLILLREKLSSVITSSRHVVGCGANSGKGFFFFKLPSQSSVVGPLLSHGPCRPSLKVCDLPLVLLVSFSSLCLQIKMTLPQNVFLVRLVCSFFCNQ